MKTKTPPTTNVVKFNKTSQFKVNAEVEQMKAERASLEAIKVNLGSVLTAADFALILEVVVEKFNTLNTAPATPETRKAYIADEAKRKANGNKSRSYDEFLTSHAGVYAKARWSMLQEGKKAEADFKLESILSTVEKLVKLDAALTAATK